MDTVKPNKRVIKRWVEALRSGKYKQGKGTLRIGDKFCCLGVLCDLHSRTKDGSKWDSTNHYFGEPATLPETVRMWAGLSSNNPRVSRFAEGGKPQLAALNDRGHPFDAIATLIEREFLGGGK